MHIFKNNKIIFHFQIVHPANVVGIVMMTNFVVRLALTVTVSINLIFRLTLMRN